MKKITTIITCALIMISGLFVMNDNQIFAAVTDTFTEGDFEYKITEEATTNNGKVDIINYNEDSPTTDLTIPNTVDFDGITYDVVSIKSGAFQNAEHIKNLTISKNLTNMSVNTNDFVYLDETTYKLRTVLEKITVDKDNPVFEVIDGVLYDTTAGTESMILYPYATKNTHYKIPDFIYTSSVNWFESFFARGVNMALHIESIEISSQYEKIFTENGVVYQWIKSDDHSKGSRIILIPNALKEPVIANHTADLTFVLENTGYYIFNKAEKFTINQNDNYRIVDGNIYSADKMLLYPGGCTDSVYKIPEGTETLGNGLVPVFLANLNLKSLILPSNLVTVEKGALASNSLKSIKIEGAGNINWSEFSFDLHVDDEKKIHTYVDNGNTTVKQKMQAVISHLTDEYFHELGAVPTATVTEVKTSLENKKDVKITWKSNGSNVNYEVRRYDINGTYEVVGSTTDTSFVDKTTAYNTTYKYEVIPYSLPVTSSQDSEDPLSTYHTFGTASAKSEIKTPVQSFQGTYVYKDADGKEVSITKTVEAGQSVASNAPTIPTVTGYTFDKWTSDLTNIEVVDKDFIATATYKKIGSAGDSNDSDDTNNPDTSGKPSGNDTNQSFDKKEETVITGDQTSVLVPIVTLIITSAFLTVVLRKKKN